jgi:hypothetical protein
MGITTAVIVVIDFHFVGGKHELTVELITWIIVAFSLIKQKSFANI